MEIKTRHLILRKAKKSDAKELSGGLADKEVSKFMTYVPLKYNGRNAKTFLEKHAKDYAFVIQSGDGAVIGGIGWHLINQNIPEFEIGYWLNKNYWRQGFASEAVAEILKYLFIKQKAKRITLTCNSKNKGSLAIAKKFKFKKEGVLKNAHFSPISKTLGDKIIFGLQKNNWKKK